MTELLIQSYRAIAASQAGFSMSMTRVEESIARITRTQRAIDQSDKILWKLHQALPTWDRQRGADCELGARID